MEKKNIKNWQIRIFILCWCAYACIYFGRVNISAAIPRLQDYLMVSKTQIGLIGSIFFWVYGAGQLINGCIGDRVSGRLYIFTGLAVTALANIFFGFAASFTVMCILWAVNGYFQSMLWGPMARIISSWVPPGKRSSAAIGVSTSMVGGFLLAWGLSGQILKYAGWRWVFLIPGFIILIYSAIWYTGARNRPEDVGLASPGDEEMHSGSSAFSCAGEKITIWTIIKKSRLWFIIAACLAQGIVKDSINLWAPTFFYEKYSLDIKAAAGMILIIPVMNFFGMLLAGKLNQKLGGREKAATALLFLLGITMILGLITFGNVNLYAGLVFLGLSSAAMYGANTLLLGVIPMSYAKYGRVSSIAGILDFCAYLAAGSAAAVTGLIVEMSGWNGVLIFWLAVTASGAAALIASDLLERRHAPRETAKMG